MKRTITIGTRGSTLALSQAESVRARLSELHRGVAFELMIIKTTGDRILDSPLSKIGDKGLFTKEIEKELLAGTIDCAVHSMKDLPTALPDGCVLAAATERLDPRDAFISSGGRTLDELPPGAVIATSSLRRKAQLLISRPDLSVIDIRGNVNSRLTRLRADGSIDGIILAAAGLHRLDMSAEITEMIPIERIIPAVGQASLAVEIRTDDQEVRSLVSPLNHVPTMTSVMCERAFLSSLEGGCQVPVAGHAVTNAGRLTMRGLVASLDGRTVFRENREGPMEDAEMVGRSLAGSLLEMGADKILQDIYSMK